MNHHKTNRLAKLISLLMAMAMVLALAACSNTNTTTEESTTAAETTTAAPKGTVRLATTTSVNDSGLLPYLLPTFEAETGWKVEVASAGTGVAIGYAKSGDADLLLVHSKDQEEEFINEGYASTERQSFMFNYFVLVGPKADPAGVKGTGTAAEAFKKIADAKQPFCSRGDNSGTHNKELKIWTAAAPVLKLDPAWYTSVGSGMGDTLTKANEMNAYCLTDKATFLSMKDQLGNLDIFVAESDDMKNTYSLIGVNPEATAFAGKNVTINTEGANALMEWLQGDEASALIKEYGIEEYGEQLFQLM